MLKWFAARMIGRAERRIGVGLDYVREISDAGAGLLYRYSKLSGFLDPNTKVPADAHHIARLRGAISADCGTCVEAEINLARAAGAFSGLIAPVVGADYSGLPENLAAVAQLADAVAGRRDDEPVAGEAVLRAYGQAGLVELSFAMKGAALLPGIKRAMGHAATCDLQTLRKLA